MAEVLGGGTTEELLDKNAVPVHTGIGERELIPGGYWLETGFTKVRTLVPIVVTPVDPNTPGPDGGAALFDATGLREPEATTPVDWGVVIEEGDKAPDPVME